MYQCHTNEHLMSVTWVTSLPSVICRPTRLAINRDSTQDHTINPAGVGREMHAEIWLWAVGVSCTGIANVLAFWIFARLSSIGYPRHWWPM